MAEMRVAIDGSASTALTVSGTTTSNQGTAAASAGAWPIKLVDSGGANVANVFPSGAVKVQVDPATTTPVTTGSAASVITLNALTAVGPGVVVDFASAKANVTLAITTTAGVSAGQVDLQVSHDTSNWFTIAGAALTASKTTAVSTTGAWRYARGSISTAVTGGTVSATLMAS